MADAWKSPESRTLEAVRARQTIERLRSLHRGLQWFKTHAMVAGLLGLESPEDAIGRFAHVNAAKCTQNKLGKKVADKKLFENCRQFVEHELEILNPEVLVSQGKQAHRAVRMLYDQIGEEVAPGCWRVGSLILIQHAHPTVRDGSYARQRSKWPEYREAILGGTS
jgi:hypothetical protein